MSSSPINGYFKQLQDYCVAKADRAHNSAQTNSTDPMPDRGYREDSVTLSSGGVEPSRPVRPPNAYSYLDTLTDSDKDVVKAATGWDIDADPIGVNISPEAWALVGRLNLDRACGALTGDIDKSYIDKLIEENFAPQQGQTTVPLSALYNVMTYFSHRATNP